MTRVKSPRPVIWPSSYDIKERNVSPPELIAFVCKTSKITVEQFMSDKKNKFIIKPRMIVSKILYSSGKFSLTQVAKHTGRYDHSTIHSQLGKIDRYLADDAAMMDVYNKSYVFFRHGPSWKDAPQPAKAVQREIARYDRKVAAINRSEQKERKERNIFMLPDEERKSFLYRRDMTIGSEKLLAALLEYFKMRRGGLSKPV